MPIDTPPDSNPKPPRQNAVVDVKFPQPTQTEPNLIPSVEGILESSEIKGLPEEDIDKFKTSKFYTEFKKLSKDEKVNFEKDFYSNLKVIMEEVIKAGEKDKQESEKLSAEDLEKYEDLLLKVITVKFLPQLEKFSDLTEFSEKIITFYKFKLEHHESFSPDIKILNNVPLEVIRLVGTDKTLKPEISQKLIYDFDSANLDQSNPQAIKNLLDNLLYLYNTPELASTKLDYFRPVEINGLVRILSEKTKDESKIITDSILKLINDNSFNKDALKLSLNILQSNILVSINPEEENVLERVEKVSKFFDLIKQNPTRTEEGTADYLHDISDIFTDLRNKGFQLSLDPENYSFLSEIDLSNYKSWVNGGDYHLRKLVRNEQDLQLFLKSILTSDKIKERFESINSLPYYFDFEFLEKCTLENINEVVNSKYVSEFSDYNPLKLQHLIESLPYYEALKNSGIHSDIIPLIMDHYNLSQEVIEQIKSYSPNEIVELCVHLTEKNLPTGSLYRLETFDKTMAVCKEYLSKFSDEELEKHRYWEIEYLSKIISQSNIKSLPSLDYKLNNLDKNNPEFQEMANNLKKIIKIMLELDIKTAQETNLLNVIIKNNLTDRLLEEVNTSNQEGNKLQKTDILMKIFENDLNFEDQITVRDTILNFTYLDLKKYDSIFKQKLELIPIFIHGYVDRGNTTGWENFISFISSSLNLDPTQQIDILNKLINIREKESITNYYKSQEITLYLYTYLQNIPFTYSGEFAEKVIDIYLRETFFDSLVLNIDKFSDFDQANVISKIIAGNKDRFIKPGIRELAANFSKFNNLSPEDRKNFSIKLSEMGYFRELITQGKERNFFLETTEEDLLRYLNEAMRLNPEWDSIDHVQKPFKDGAALFGNKKMLVYMMRADVTPHDALLPFNKLTELSKLSGFESKKFFNNILMQVAQDSSDYSTGNSYSELNSILNSLPFGNINEILKVQADIPELFELIKSFKNQSGEIDFAKVFESWSRLKKFSGIVKILQRKDILLKLKDEKRPKVRDYITTIAFHNDSRVDIEAAIQFYENPAQFFERGASHTTSEVQDRKKPSNYVKTRYINLPSVELRDSLIEGDLDKISAFKPYEISYTINKNLLNKSLLQIVSESLDRNQSYAKNRKQVYNNLLNRVFEGDKIKLNEYLSGSLTLTKEQEGIVREIVFDKNTGYILKESENMTLVATVFPKSDPVGVLAGNDTACCMPFGDGKNTVYTYNPNVSQFALRIVGKDGSMRTIAQSVLTQDISIQKDFSLTLDLQGINPAVRKDKTRFIACDNIEVAANYASNNVIWSLYEDFFKNYVDFLNQNGGNFSPIIPIGTGYSDVTGTQKRTNTFSPLIQVSYSDKRGPQVYVIDSATLTPTGLAISKKIHAAEIPANPSESELKAAGMSYLTYEDALFAGYVEELAFKDNPSLISGWNTISNTLISKDIYNSRNNRPNMSLKHENAEGAMDAYIISYEGRDDSINNGDNFLYIYDLAADPNSSKLAPGKLLYEYINLYIEKYLKTDNAIPIYAEARDQTSYKLIVDSLSSVLTKLNIPFEVEELGTYQEGNDTMHKVLIKIKA